jgi:hypothetical protein
MIEQEKKYCIRKKEADYIDESPTNLSYPEQHKKRKRGNVVFIVGLVVILKKDDGKDDDCD